jgi:energy-coupling factor transporter ATP-binding protein EcfA2
MQLRAYAISVRGPHAPLLRATSVAVRDHELVLLSGYPGPGHVAVSLALSGRLRPDGGEVRVDGQDDDAVLRRRVAVVDTPGITEPDDALPVKAIVGEELAIAGRKAGRKAVQEWLTEHGGAEHAERRFEHLPVDVRTRLLAELTVARAEVEVVIMTMPDRFGGDPHEWYALGRELAGRGYGVIVTCAEASARLLGVPAAQLGSVDQPEPERVEAEQVEAAPVEAVETEAVEAEAVEVADKADGAEAESVVRVDDEVREEGKA